MAMKKKNSHLFEQLKSLKDKTISFTDQYNAETKNPDVDLFHIEINKLKEVVLAHTEMKKLLEQKEEALSVLYSYLDEDKFNANQTELITLLNVQK